MDKMSGRAYVQEMSDFTPLHADLAALFDAHGLTPDEYRARYGLKPDYPMVAASYSERRREVAKKLGLGRKPGQTVQKAPSKPRGRPKKVG